MPFSVVVSERNARAFSVNRVGLERRGFTPEQIQKLHRAVRLLTKSGLNTEQALAKIHEELEIDEHMERLIAFIQGSQRGVVK